MPDVTARPLAVGDLDERQPRPTRRLDMYAALAAAGVACAVLLAALLTGASFPRTLAIVFYTVTPVFAALTLLLMWRRSPERSDAGQAWFTAGLAVAVVAMALEVLALPQVSSGGGPLRTQVQARSVLFLLFHLAPALGAVAGALDAPARWRRPATAAGVVLVLVVAGDVLPVPMLTRPDQTFTATRLLSEGLLVLLMGACTATWVVHVGRTPTAIRVWIGVALSLATYEVLLNALAGARYTPLWWGSLFLRLATWAVLAFGLLWTVLNQLRDLEAYSASELNRRESQLSAALTQTRRLLRCSEDLAQAVTPREVATALAADVAAMTGLPHVAVMGRDVGGPLRALGTEGYGGELAEWARQVDWAAPLPAARALISGESVFLSTEEEVRRLFPGVLGTPLSPAQAMAALPLAVRGEPVAAVVVWDVAPVSWTPAARELLAGLAAQGAQALARALAFEEAASRAATLQASLLPSTLPRRTDVAVAVRYAAGVPAPARTGDGVGGDWYDCIAVDAHRVALVVGDVMGKGLHAAAVMGQMRTTLRALTAIDPSPRVVLGALDRVTRDLDVDEIATVAYVLLDSRAGSAVVGRAGHLPPLVAAPGGPVTAIEAGGSPPLGSPAAEWDQTTVEVPPGSLLVLYSDGLVEDRRTGLEPGLSSLTAAVARLAGTETDVEVVASTVMEQLGAPDRDDDMTLLVVRLEPAAPVSRAESPDPTAAGAGGS